jgi:hypothetical protein
MKALAQNIRMQFDEERRQEIVLTMKSATDISSLKEIVKSKKLLSIEIKQHRFSRSLNSNAYLWVLLERMADALKTSKDELYLLMLERYGVFTHVIVKPEAVNRMMLEWRTVRNLGEVVINGQHGFQLQCYFGSSTYDTKEMSRLIDGVVSECRDIGIETLSREEIETMNQAWGRS